MLEFQAVATIENLPFARRYDIVVLNPKTGFVFGVEVKSTLFSAFKLDPQQVQFDVRAIQIGAAFTKSAQIDGVMYRGVEFGSGPAAAWHSLRLMSELKAAGITFHAHKSPGPQ